jgi:LuxR family transcriptional regulator, regulator of acetate metabolism
MSGTDADQQLATIRTKLRDVDARLADLGRTERAQAHAAALQTLRERFERRFALLESAHASALTLSAIASPAELLQRAPRALVEGTRFKRALLSAVGDGTLSPVAAHFATADIRAVDEDLAADAMGVLKSARPHLDYRLVESDVIRRRRASLVTEANRQRAAPVVPDAIGSHTYVVAPIVSASLTVAVIHAAPADDDEPDLLDRDALAQFTTVLSGLYESAALRRTLLRERDAVKLFAARLTDLSLTLADVPITVSGQGDSRTTSPVVSQPALAAAPPALADDDRLVFAGLLTPREIEVVRLLAGGGTTRSIASSLVVAEATVKFHVNSILRKLHVANRAAAVAKYLSLVGVPQVH